MKMQNDYIESIYRNKQRERKKTEARGGGGR